MDEYGELVVKTVYDEEGHPKWLEVLAAPQRASISLDLLRMDDTDYWFTTKREYDGQDWVIMFAIGGVCEYKIIGINPFGQSALAERLWKHEGIPERTEQ